MAETPTPHLDDLARQVAADPHFLAHALAALQARAGLTDGLLALTLAMPAGNLTHLRLCRMPGTDPRHTFEEDVATIAARVDCDPARLADLLLSEGGDAVDA